MDVLSLDLGRGFAAFMDADCWERRFAYHSRRKGRENPAGGANGCLGRGGQQVTQTTLDFDRPLARHTDPQTSHAGQSHVAPKLSQLHQRFVSVVAEHGPMTAAEVAAECVKRYGGLSESSRKRAGELVRRGLIEVCGIKKCSVTNCVAQVYRIAEEST